MGNTLNAKLSKIITSDIYKEWRLKTVISSIM